MKWCLGEVIGGRAEGERETPGEFGLFFKGGLCRRVLNGKNRPHYDVLFPQLNFPPFEGQRRRTTTREDLKVPAKPTMPHKWYLNPSTPLLLKSGDMPFLCVS